MFKFDGIHASEMVDKVLDVVRPGAAPLSARLLEIPDRPGAYDFGTDRKPYPIEARLLIKGNDREELWRKVRAVNAWLIKKELKKLELDDEPGLYYLARVEDAIDLEEILEFGFATVKFIAPDADAYGLTKTERLDSPGMVFERASVRYKDDGTEITTHYPYYKSGRFNESVLVEEGTENLLTTAAAPAVEEVSVTSGLDYHLSYDAGSVTIEHKRAETLNRALDKEGQDYTNTVDTGWESGTHVNTVEVGNQFLQLAKGTDFAKVWLTQADWNDPSNIRDNTIGTPVDTLELDNLPEWEFVDDMSDYAANWRIQTPTAGGTVTQNDGYVTIAGMGVTGGNFGIDTQNNANVTVTFPCTLYFLYRGRNTANVRFIIEDGTANGYTYQLNDAENKWNHYYIRATTTEAIIYKNGVQVATLSNRGGGTANQIQIDIANGGSGDFDIGAVYADWNYDKGPPPSDGWWSGTWESPYMSLSNVGFINYSEIGWSYWYGAFNYEEFLEEPATFADVKIEYQLKVNGVEQGWKTIFNDPGSVGGDSAPIPDLPKGADARNTEIKLRITFRTFDPNSSPWMDVLELIANAGYYKTGHRDSPTLTGLRQVGKAANTAISWTANTPASTSVKVHTRHSLDGGTSWTDWVEAANGGPIPGITQSTDLSNASFQYRVELATDDVAVTPSVDTLSLSFTAGYKPSQTFTLSPVDVSSVGTAVGSVLSWVESKPTSTSVIVEASLDGTNWTPVTNGGALVPSGTDLAGKSLHIRYTLSTSDTSITPTLQSIEWRIAQAEPHRIKPATGVIVLTPSGVGLWQLEPKTYATSWHAYGEPRAPEVLRVYIPELLRDEEGTIELWAYDDGRDIRRRYVFETSGKTFAFYRDANGTYVVEVGGTPVLSASKPATGWHRWSIRWNGTAVDLFRDGVLRDSAVLGEPFSLVEAPFLFLGCDSTGGNQFNERLDDLVLSKVARTDTDIANRYQSEAPAPRDEDSAVYHFDGNLLSDVTRQVIVSGTSETYPVFTVTFATPATYAKVSNGIDYVQINRNFNPGDVLVIDCFRQVVTLNGSRLAAMPFLDFDSNFFAVTSEHEITFEPLGGAVVDIQYTERWL